MGGLFSKPDTSAQERQLALQREQLAAQEKRQQEQMAQQGAEMSAAARARSQAGRRMLLSEREDAETGLGTLGTGAKATTASKTA